MSGKRQLDLGYVIMLSTREPYTDSQSASLPQRRSARFSPMSPSNAWDGFPLLFVMVQGCIETSPGPRAMGMAPETFRVLHRHADLEFVDERLLGYHTDGSIHDFTVLEHEQRRD